jgi:predicted DNA-binding ribbon-helix-helix protein
VSNLDPQLSLFDVKVTESKELKITLEPSEWKEIHRMATNGKFTVDEVVSELVHSWLFDANYR